MLTHPEDYNDLYRGLLEDILYGDGPMEVNSRTGHTIHMVEGGWSFKLTLNGQLPVLGNRRYYPHVAAAETAWQFMGTTDPTWILSKAPKLWSKFVEDGKLRTAYGWRWREAFGRDQLDLAMAELRDNPTNRQLHVSAWDPRSDGLGGPQPKNVPCPVGFTINRMDDALHMSVHIRSSDVFVGLPYDVMCYSLTLDAIARTLGLEAGTVHFTLAHAHLYDVHLGMTEACLDGGSHETWESGCSIPLPGWTIPEILADRDQYVGFVRTLGQDAARSDWDPLPEVVE